MSTSWLSPSSFSICSTTSRTRRSRCSSTSTDRGSAQHTHPQAAVDDPADLEDPVQPLPGALRERDCLPGALHAHRLLQYGAPVHLGQERREGHAARRASTTESPCP